MSKRVSFLRVVAGLMLLSMALSSAARQGTPPLSRQQRVQALAAIRQFTVPPTDPRTELAADARAGNAAPLRFAIPTPVQITPATDGTWEPVPGGRLWRLRVVSAGATDLNFGFTTCFLPNGATLHVYSEDEDYFQGPYSARDNKPHEQLWTPVLPGGRAVIELFVPANIVEEPRLVLTQINRGYRDVFHRDKNQAFPKAGSCNIDVVCPEASSWQNEIRSVARYSISGVYFCTGTLINNASNDLKGYFLTANHCDVSPANAATIVVYWNYQSPACGQHSGGSLTQNQNGAIFRMAKADVDMTLLELEDIPDSTFQVFYSGWDRSGIPPTGAVCIHHPSADEKSISFSRCAVTTIDKCITDGGVGRATHWQVSWDLGVTETGSSGSGLWDPHTHRLVGTLSGGSSACSFPYASDCYGKFSVAWDSGASASSRLRDWLDPANTGITNMPGRDPNPVLLIVAVNSSLIAEGCAPTNGVIDPGETVTVSFSIQNIGSSNSIDIVGTLLAANGVMSPGPTQHYGSVIAGGSPVSRSFSFVAVGDCGGFISPQLQLQDGTNILGTLAFTFRLGLPATVFTQRFDSVVAPALPSGWVNTGSNTVGWTTTSSSFDTAPNSAVTGNPSDVSEAWLTSPAIAIVNTNAQLSFAHNFETEGGYDGGTLEIAYGNGAFYDILTAGGSFVFGGYNEQISGDDGSPIANRRAWSGSNSMAVVRSLVNLPVAAAGQNIHLRWHMATDLGAGATGWYVDTVSISDGFSCCRTVPQIFGATLTNNSFVFSFNTVSGQTYITEYKSAVTTNEAWRTLQTDWGNGMRITVTNTVLVGTNRFFRIRTE